jgi:hypothetical protein
MSFFLRTLALGSVVCAASQSAMATPVPAPGPEIGDGIVGAAVAAVALLAFVLLPQLKRSLQAAKD